MILKNGKRIDGLGDNMPIGSIVEYNGTDIPDGWDILPGDANIYMGPVEPTEGQDVWMQLGDNLFDKDKVISGGILIETGAIYNDANLITTDYIDVNNINRIYWNKQAEGDRNWGAFYDANKVYISGYEHTNNFQDVPIGAVYFRTNFRVTDIDDVIIRDYNKKIYTKNDNGAYEEFNINKWGGLTEDILTENTTTSWLAVTDDKGNMQHRTIENIIGSFGLLKGIKIDHYGNDLLQMPNNTVGSYYNDYTQNIPDINVFAGWGLAIMLGVNDYKALIVFGNYEHAGHNIAIKSFVPGNPGSWTDWRYI
jgi:hypothetical protein